LPQWNGRNELIGIGSFRNKQVRSACWVVPIEEARPISFIPTIFLREFASNRNSIETKKSVLREKSILFSPTMSGILNN